MSLHAFLAASPLTIGVLGGSFNPAHAGHLHISLEACKRLQLDAVWWLVSPGNPLKDPATLAPFDTRYEYATHLAAPYRHITVSDFERQYGVRYTVDTVRALQLHFPQHRFVWLMGSDNLKQFHRWEGWVEIANRLPIAVLDRSPFTHNALRSPFALRFAGARTPYPQLCMTPPPAWDMLFIRRHPESATHLRKTLGENAFLGHNRK
jgi:nicotinate-nucleotide adenylyltransferase